MPFVVPIEEAQRQFPAWTFIRPLTPSEQKAAFQVRDTAGAHYCFKIIAPDYEFDRLEREIRALQSINHPNVVRLVEYTFSSKAGVGEQHYLIEDFIDGDDLSARLGSPWSRASAAELFARLCAGLEALNKANIVHRDLKPSNIRIRPTGEPVIIDFGVARHLDLPALTNTADGAGIGTPVYFAPEQFTGTKYDIDHRTDLFALGLLLFEAVVGVRPFYVDGMTRGDLQQAVCNSDSCFSKPGFAALPKEWQIFFRRLLARDRASRPFGAAQVSALLQKLRAI